MLLGMTKSLYHLLLLAVILTVVTSPVSALWPGFFSIISSIGSIFKAILRMWNLMNPATGIMNVLQGRRRSRSADGVDPLAAVFESLAKEDPQQCLPLVLCAIHSDTKGLRTHQENEFVKIFRPLVSQRHSPSWSEPWVLGVRQGTSAARSKPESEGDLTCRKAFPKCPFSAKYIRALMADTLDGNTESHESSNEPHLDINLVET